MWRTASPMTWKFRITASTTIPCSANVSSVSPFVYRWILPIASSTRSMRSCQRLSADMERLPEDVFAESRIHAIAWHKVHAAHAQATLQMLLHGNQVEQGNRATEF